ncbi:hypothetical protein V9T40_002157 [Parthenolecanium corni]|uniref:cGMP-dependent protein kinase interacting domain-containing protein n=1 Tax=Parthenolecanium corni TaxID=536013 RepID=A0AAN9THX4_9HEMI
MLQNNNRPRQRIDPDEARNKEERVMLQHAREWLNSGKFEDIPHDKTGATALHVAASKGYIKVMDTLIQAGADVNAEDYDGWTPLHAAAHWGQKEACEILVENFCDMDKKNYVGQTAFDVSEGEMVRLLEELRKKHLSLQKERKDIVKETPPKKSRLSLNEKDMPPYNQLIIEDVISSMDTVPIVELTVETEKKARSKIMEENDKNVRLSNEEKQVPSLPDTTPKVPINSVPAPQSPKPTLEDEDARVPSWRKTTSLRNAIKTPFRFEDEKPWLNSVSGDRNDEKTPEVALRRTQSFEADDKFYRRYCELKAKIESGNTLPVLIPPANNTNTLPMRSASLKEKQRRGLTHEDIKVPATSTLPTNTATSITTSIPSSTIQETVPAVNSFSNHSSIRSAIKNGLNNIIAGEPTTMSAPSTPTASKLSPGNIFKNFFKSFVPPVRDEESETQRKAHAKRVRETRRSTQGVTLEEIKSAEQLVKKKQQQQQQLQQVSSQLNSSTPTTEQTQNADTYMQNSEPASISVSATITTGTTTVPQCNKNTNERRPSWRLRIDNGCKFMLEDVRHNDKDSESTKENMSPSWSSTQPATNELIDTASVTIPLRKSSKTSEDSEPVKTEKDKTLPTAQPINPRRKRTKRRSTGNVSFDPDEENDRLNCDNNEVNDIADNDRRSVDALGVRLSAMSYRQRSSSSSRRSQRPNSFSGTSSTPSSRLRSAYPSASGGIGTTSSGISSAYGIYGSSPSSPSSWSSSATGSSYPSSLTTYGGTTSGYGGLTLPNPNTFPSHGLSTYFGNYGGRSSSPSSPSYLSSRTSFGLSPFSSGSSGISNSNQYTSPYASSSLSSAPNTSRSSDLPYVSSRPLSTASSLSGSAKSVVSEGYASGTGEKSGPPSRLSSTSSLGDADYSNRSPVTSSPNENGELDYKKLYEETLSDNERLREKLKRTEDELDDYKLRLSDSSKSSVSNANLNCAVLTLCMQANKNSLSELEKRERRAMERKLSEMEEELKQLQKLKAENERLRAENRALTRVVSKLTTSANAVK